MSATEMTLTEWMFGDGEEVSKGDIIYTLETDKTSVEIEAQARWHCSAYWAAMEKYMLWEPWSATIE